MAHAPCVVSRLGFSPFGELQLPTSLWKSMAFEVKEVSTLLFRALRICSILFSEMYPCGGPRKDIPASAVLMSARVFVDFRTWACVLTRPRNLRVHKKACVSHFGVLYPEIYCTSAQRGVCKGQGGKQWANTGRREDEES